MEISISKDALLDTENEVQIILHENEDLRLSEVATWSVIYSRSLMEDLKKN